VAGGLVTSVAVGIFARTALLVGSLGAAYANPWWNTFDILPLIKDEEEESIEQIVDNDDDQS
jgi:predicted NBD/HSP70 family sugar kinase